VTVKLLQPQGNYEKILRKEISNELSQAHWDMRGSGSSSIGTGEPDGDLRPTVTDGSFEGSRRRRQRDPLDVELENVWGQTRVVPVPSWQSRSDTGYLPAEDDSTGPQRLDDVMRGLSDTRSFGGYEESPGGVERRYGDDDL
jgi:hypothetical protein